MIKKSLISAVLPIIVLFSVNNVNAMSLNENGNYVNLNNVEMTVLEKERLINLGFTEDQIEMMSSYEFDNRPVRQAFMNY